MPDFRTPGAFMNSPPFLSSGAWDENDGADEVVELDDALGFDDTRNGGAWLRLYVSASVGWWSTVANPTWRANPAFRGV